MYPWSPNYSICSVQVESDELLEFEMLEEAANMSFSSLLNDSSKHDPSKHALSRPQPSAYNWSSTNPSRGNENSALKSDVANFREQRVSYHFEPIDEHDTSADLDETLKFSPSLAKGVEFSDEEAWESFSHGSPQSHHRTESSGSDITLPHPSPPGRKGAWRSPVKREVLASNVGFVAPRQTAMDGRYNSRTQCELPDTLRGGANRIAAVEKCKVLEQVSSTGGSASYLPESTKFSDYPTAPQCHNAEAGGGGPSVHNSLPPPSALVSKLFPVLRRVEEAAKVIPNGSTKPCHTSEGHTPITKSPSPISSTEGDSGIRSLSSSSVALSKDLKYKLNQLEEEIARYRSENISLENLRKERESVSINDSILGQLYIFLYW